MLPVPHIPVIPLREWNETRELARRNRVFRGTGLYFTFTPGGVLLSLAPAAAFAHPWQLTCSWRPPDPQSPIREQRSTGAWIATVRPGFVNCADVTINEERVVQGSVVSDDFLLIDEQPPVLVFDGFRDPAASSGLSIDEDGELVQGAGEGYPAFFDQLGVTPAAKGGDLNQSTFDPDRTRQIRACDIVLITPRPAAAQQVTVLDPTIDAQSVSVSTVITGAAGPSRLEVVPQWSPPRQPSAAEVLEGSAVEPTTDEIKLSTLYLVSPPDASPEDPPDQTWTPYPAYFVFWNLAHCSQAPVLVAPPDPLQLQVPLAAGVGQSLVDAMLSPLNDSAALISAYFNTVSFQGRYWAPGGVGWDSQTRPVRPTTAPPIDGFKPSSVNAANRDTAPAPPVLNPPFPFLRTRFDPIFFGLQKDPPAT